MSVYATPGPEHLYHTCAAKKRRKPRKITRRHRRLKGQAPPNATSAKNVNSYHACLPSTPATKKSGLTDAQGQHATHPRKFFGCPSPFPFCGSRSGGLLADQQGIKPPPVCQRRQERRPPTEPRGHVHACDAKRGCKFVPRRHQMTVDVSLCHAWSATPVPAKRWTKKRAHAALAAS